MIIPSSLNADIYKNGWETKSTISLAGFGTLTCEKAAHRGAIMGLW